MTDPALPGLTPPAPRRRGRPLGSTNKRPKDLAGWVGGVAGSSAAMQSAQLCLVTERELRAAKGDHARAVVAKAARHVEAFEAEADRIGKGLREMIRQELRLLVEEIGTVEADQVRGMCTRFLDKVQAPGGRLTLRQAVEMIAEERRALMPYTDQRQPQLVAVKGEGFAPAVVFMGAAVQPQEKQGVIEGASFEVLQDKSHEPSEG